jgi:hypothetical protein
MKELCSPENLVTDRSTPQRHGSEDSLIPASCIEVHVRTPSQMPEQYSKVGSINVN